MQKYVQNAAAMAYAVNTGLGADSSQAVNERRESVGIGVLVLSNVMRRG